VSPVPSFESRLNASRFVVLLAQIVSAVYSRNVVCSRQLSNPVLIPLTLIELPMSPGECHPPGDISFALKWDRR
jgi:hypothetical protein